MAYHKVTCGECQSPMELRESMYGKFWGCTRFPDCKGTHGAHRDSGAPLGVPADKATKQARMAAHAEFDKLWSQGQMDRKEAYSWLMDAMGKSRDDAHIGKFNKEECQRLVSVLKATAGV